MIKPGDKVKVVLGRNTDPKTTVMEEGMVTLPTLLSFLEGREYYVWDVYGTTCTISESAGNHLYASSYSSVPLNCVKLVGEEKEEPICPIVDKVIAKYEARAEMGFKKYGVNADRNDLSLLEWLNHLQDELMDATIYIEKLKKEC